MNRDEATRLVAAVTRDWLADPESSVEWAGEYDGRRGIRMRQEVREATTVWFTIGDRTVGYEAYLLPQPPHDAEHVYHLCLARNRRSWPAAINIDERGDLFVGGRIPLSDLTRERLDEAVGAVYETVELTFHTLVEVGFSPREKSR